MLQSLILSVRSNYEIQIILRKNDKRLVGTSHQVCDCMHPSLCDCGFALVINYLGIWLMNKLKVDKIMEEVLTEIELDDAVEQLKEWYKVGLCDKLVDVFTGARHHAHGWKSTCTKQEAEQNKVRYELIEPLIDEAVEKYLKKGGIA